jgi:hypothetical protein
METALDNLQQITAVLEAITGAVKLATTLAAAA